MRGKEKNNKEKEERRVACQVEEKRRCMIRRRDVAEGLMKRRAEVMNGI